MCRFEVFLLHMLKGSMSSDARDFNNIETRAIINFFPARQGAEGNSCHSEKKTLEEYAPMYGILKNWVTRFKLGDFSTCGTPRPGRPKRVTTPEIMVQIHELNFVDRRILLIQYLSNWAPHGSRLGPLLVKIWTCRKSPQNGYKMAEMVIKTSKFPIVWAKNGIFRCIQMISSRLLTMEETWLHHYDPRTKLQFIEWRHSGSPRIKMFRVKHYGV